MIAGVVLAAGLSRRMGQPKMVLPWGDHTVVAQVVSVLMTAGVGPIFVVTGGARLEVEAALAGLPVQFAFNPDFADGEMVHSLQAGLRALPASCEAVLMALGDQPQIQTGVVVALMGAYREGGSGLDRTQLRNAARPSLGDRPEPVASGAVASAARQPAGFPA